VRAIVARRPALETLRRATAGGAQARAAEQGAEELEDLARSKALKGDVRSVQAACRAGGTRRVKVETVERLCRKVLGTDPHTLYGEGFDRAWQHRGKRVNERVQAFDHCFCSPKSVSLLAAGGGDRVRREVAAGRAEALQVGIGYLERHGIGVRRDHNGTDRHHVRGGLVAVAFEHRMSRAGDPQRPHPRTRAERRPRPRRALDRAGLRPAVRPPDGGRSPVPGGRAGGAHRTPGRPLGAGG
jgi:TrwC relaxase